MSLLKYTRMMENDFKRIELIDLTDQELDTLIDTCLKHKMKYGNPDFHGNRETGTLWINNPIVDKGLSDLVNPYNLNGYEYDLNTPSLTVRKD